jgi:DNA modification methylase
LKKLPIHPLADMLPRMTPAEFAGLKASISLAGQTDPVILLNGKVLDGRHRQDACAELGIECRYTEFKKAWGEPATYVMAKATHRNLTDSQKATAAGQFADLLVDDGKERKGKNLRRGTSGPSENMDALGRSIDRAAALFGISASYVKAARWLRLQDTHAFGRVFAGNMKLSVAVSQVRKQQKSKAAVAAPAQPLTPIAGHFTLVTADCTAANGLAALPRKSARLIFADPPYNIGIDYGQGKAGDQLPAEKFIAWCGSWIAEAKEILTPDGSLWLLISDEFAAEICVMAKSHGLHLRRWIKWYETFGVNCSDNFNRTSRHLFYLVKDAKQYVFNAAEFNRRSARQELGDKRANPAGKIWDDVWGINPPIPRLVGNAAERMPDFPTQLPLALVKPIVAGCTDLGDVVVDPFNGSGTTGEAAVSQGRHYIGFDKESRFIDASSVRLQKVGRQCRSIDELLKARTSHPVNQRRA